MSTCISNEIFIWRTLILTCHIHSACVCRGGRLSIIFVSKNKSVYHIIRIRIVEWSVLLIILTLWTASVNTSMYLMKFLSEIPKPWDGTTAVRNWDKPDRTIRKYPQNVYYFFYWFHNRHIRIKNDAEKHRFVLGSFFVNSLYLQKTFY